MTNETFIKEISGIDISKAKTLIPNKAVYVANYNEYVILLDNEQRIGGIYIMGDFDLHILIFERFRGQHYASDFMKSGWIKKLRPNLKSISSVHSQSTLEYKIVKHLADLAKLELRTD